MNARREARMIAKPFDWDEWNAQFDAGMADLRKAIDDMEQATEAVAKSRREWIDAVTEALR